MATDKDQEEKEIPKENKDQTLSSQFSLSYDSKPISDLAKAITDQTNTQKYYAVEAAKINEKAAEARATQRIARRANVIAIAAIFANCLLLCATLLIYCDNKRGIDAAVGAARAADSTFRESRRYNSISLAKQDSASANSSRDWRSRFLLDSNSVADQIKVMKGTLAETRGQFKVNNTSRLIIEDISFDGASDEKRQWSGSFSLENSGGGNLQILDYGFAGHSLLFSQLYGTRPSSFDQEFYLKETYHFNPDYAKGGNIVNLIDGCLIPKEGTVRVKFLSYAELPQDEYALCKKGAVLFYGFIQYRNILLNKKYVARFVFEPPSSGYPARIWDALTYEQINGKETLIDKSY